MENQFIIGKKIEGWEYPERYCSYCQRDLYLAQVAHIQDTPEHFKAVFICLNSECGAYDEEGHKAYVRLYYSSPQAEEALATYQIWMARPKKS